MPKNQIMTVVNGSLGAQEDGRFHPHIPVGTDAWFLWLEHHKGFAYQDEAGSFTARCEQIKGKGAYWYAYRRHGKKVRKKYLGKAERLTPERLREIALALAETPGTVTPSALSSEAFSPLPKMTQTDPKLNLSAAKFIPPMQPVHLVDRSRLTEQLSTPISYVNAPAGYGKSTLVSQWLHLARLPFIWVTLDINDDSQAQFWQVVFTAIRLVFPQVLPEPGPTIVDATRSVLTELGDNIQKLENPLCLVLDDFHHIKNEAILEDVTHLLEHLPSQLRVVFISRAQAPFNVGRWRAKGQYVDLDLDALRLTPDEGVAYLEKMTTLDRQEMLAISEQMEGWVTGLQLVSLALRNRINVQKYLALPEKSIDYLKSYLVEDVLEHEPEQVQTFLLQVAILPALSIELCDAVTGQDNAATMLAYLVKENLFVSAVPWRPGRYRMHQVFAEILADLLLTRLPDQVNDLHLRAARWFKAADLTRSAIDHLLNAQAWPEAAALIEKNAPTVFMRGEVARLLHWTDRLPPTVLKNHPLLVMTYARIRRFGKDLGDSYPSSNDSVEVDGSQLLNRLTVLEPALTEEENPAEFPPNYQCIWQTIDLMIRVLGYQAVGDWQSAEQALEKIMALGATYGHSYLTFQAVGMLAIQHVEQGHLRQGEQIINQGARQGQRPISQLPSTLGIGQSIIHFQRNQLVEAHDLLKVILARTDSPYQSEIQLRIRSLLVRTLTASDKNEEAEKLMSDIVTELSHKQMSWLSRPDIAADRAYMWLLHDKLALAEGWLVESGAQIDSGLTQENSYSQLVHAYILIAQKKYVDAEELLTNLITTFPTGIHTEPLLILLLPQAIALYGQGKVNQALRTLRQSLRLAAGEGYIRPFLNQGTDMFTLLTLVGQQEQVSQEIQRYVDLLLHEFGQAGIELPTMTRSETSTLVTAASVTAREQELLQLVAQGLSNREIAQQLMISVNTVKSHLHRVYFKLEVRNRSQAVMQAQELHLL